MIITLNKNEMPSIIRMFNKDYPHIPYTVIGEEKQENGEEIISLLITAKEETKCEMIENFFDKFETVTVTDSVGQKKEN